MKRAIVSLAVITTLALSAPVFAAPQRPTKDTPTPVITKVLNALRRAVGIKPLEDITVPKP
jgi:hypothetical protein